MKKLAIVALALGFIGFVALPAARADSLQSVLFNFDGSQFNSAAYSTAPGVNVGGFDSTTGLGTITITVTAPGAHQYDVFFDNNLVLPLFNEFGTNVGTPASGQTWEIGDSLVSSIYGDVQAGGALSNTNMHPGQTDNFLGGCDVTVDPTCNGDASMAMGFQFTVPATEQAVITLNFSGTAPGGFYLQQTHPGDATNSAPLNLFFDGNVAIGAAGPPPVPEPSSLLLMGTGLPLASFASKRRQ